MTNEELAGHLAEIRAASGALTPEAVVSAASDPTHPLHEQFQWDDTVAAAAWRRQQARHLIARVRIIVAKKTSRGVQEVKVRAFASAVYHGERQYLHVDDISADGDLADQVLNQINLDLRSLKRKYAAYGDLFAAALREFAA